MEYVGYAVLAIFFITGLIGGISERGKSDFEPDGHP